jgi:hypothetical protein
LIYWGKMKQPEEGCGPHASSISIASWARQFIFLGSLNMSGCSVWLISGLGLHWQRGQHWVPAVANLPQHLARRARSQAWFTNRPSPHILDSISSKVLGAGSFTQPFRTLQQVKTAMPFLASALLASLAFLPEMAHGDDRGKRPQNEGSSCGSQSPPPHWWQAPTVHPQ